MFTVKTYLDKSKINGTGCFADTDIQKGTIIWKYIENFDVKIEMQQFEQLPELAQEFVRHFGYFDKVAGGYIICTDNARYTNHSSDANMKTFDEVSCVASRDIKKGEEITEDYYGFDETANLKLGFL